MTEKPTYKELKKRIQQLEQSESRFKKMEKDLHKFKAISDQANYGTAIVDLKGNCEYVNDYFAKIHGFTPEELSVKHLSIFHSEKQMKEVNKINHALMEQGSVAHVEVWHIHKDGTKFPMFMNSLIIKDKTGIPQYITTTAIDMSVQKKLEAQLHQTQKMESIGTLAGGIAHDFNNILFPIIGHTEMLLEDVPQDSPLQDSLNEIHMGALRANELVKQILTFSRQNDNELMLMKIQPVIREAVKFIRSTIPATIEIKQNISADCGVIKADPTQIHQIVMNLATNAWQAMEETCGELKVELKQIEVGEPDLIHQELEPGPYACLTVADTGIGMDKDLTNKIFDPFFTTKAQGKGTGMGLSVVHGIIESMGGTIQVYSRPGKGTKFNVYLPIIKTAEKKQTFLTNESIRRGSERILLVDDEKAVIKMENRMLERLGYQVTSCTSSIEALETFRTVPDNFDLVMTDFSMPNMPGDRLAAELIKIRPDIPILLCTGFSEARSAKEMTPPSIKGFLLKPIVMKDLAQKIREILDK
jgi:PAS domain S-box-containing protein